MAERRVEVDHSTIMRYVHQYSPDIEKNVLRYLKPTNVSWRVDETYSKVKGNYKYFCIAVDSDENTIDFMLSAKLIGKAAKRFFNRLSADVFKKLVFFLLSFLENYSRICSYYFN